MPFLIIIAVLFVALIFLPNWWVSHVLKKHHNHDNSLDGTGGELAQHLIDRYIINGDKWLRPELTKNYRDRLKNILCIFIYTYKNK